MTENKLRPRLVSANKECARCKGRGWLVKEDGQACPDCQHAEMLGGTGYEQTKPKTHLQIKLNDVDVSTPEKAINNMVAPLLRMLLEKGPEQNMNSMGFTLFGYRIEAFRVEDSEGNEEQSSSGQST